MHIVYFITHSIIELKSFWPVQLTIASSEMEQAEKHCIPLATLNVRC